jgi:hypothetical protein
VIRIRLRGVHITTMQRSNETVDGRSNPGHGKGSASRREDSLQARDGHNRTRIHLG